MVADVVIVVCGGVARVGVDVCGCGGMIGCAAGVTGVVCICCVWCCCCC